MPALTLVAPVYVLLPDSVKVLEPDLVNDPLPEIVPLNVKAAPVLTVPAPASEILREVVNAPVVERVPPSNINELLALPRLALAATETVPALIVVEPV
jgi:hypothetical protein